MCEVNSKDYGKCSTCGNCNVNLDFEKETCSRSCKIKRVPVDKDFSCKNYKIKACSQAHDPHMLFSDKITYKQGYITSRFDSEEEF